MILRGKNNYIFSSRMISKPNRKMFGCSEYKKQIIERDNGIYRVWDRIMQKSYFLWFSYKDEEIKYKLLSFKNIK